VSRSIVTNRAGITHLCHLLRRAQDNTAVTAQNTHLKSDRLLVDAIVEHCSHSSFPGDVTTFETDEARAFCSVRYIVEATLDDGSKRSRYESAQIGADGSWDAGTAKGDLNLLAGSQTGSAMQNQQVQARDIRARVENALNDAEARLRTDYLNVQSVRGRIVGVMVLR
jgi:hypothetical protein